MENGGPTNAYPLQQRWKEGVVGMLMTNIDISGGLVNGALFKVLSNRKTFLKVQYYDIGTGVLKKKEHILGKHPQTFNFKKLGNTIPIHRLQIPAHVAYATTIHKTQGRTLKNLITCLNENVNEDGMAYVGVSRTESLSGLHLQALNPCSNNCPQILRTTFDVYKATTGLRKNTDAIFRFNKYLRIKMDCWRITSGLKPLSMNIGSTNTQNLLQCFRDSMNGKTIPWVKFTGLVNKLGACREECFNVSEDPKKEDQKAPDEDLSDSDNDGESDDIPLDILIMSEDDQHPVDPTNIHEITEVCINAGVISKNVLSPQTDIILCAYVLNMSKYSTFLMFSLNVPACQDVMFFWS